MEKKQFSGNCTVAPNEIEEWVHVKVNGEEITCTPMHPFYSPVKGWTSAIDLRAGDILVMLNGEYVVVEQVQHELLESPETTYNFEVEGFHTYYVGSHSTLVHNKCGDTGSYSSLKKAEAGNGTEVHNNSRGQIGLGAGKKHFYSRMEIIWVKYCATVSAM